MIELDLMDNQMETTGFIDDFISLIWTRRCYEIGEFELRSSLRDFSLFRECKYVWSKEFEELGVIEEYGYRQSDGAAYCKGRFAECLLTERIVDYYSPYFQSGTPEYLARRFVQKIGISPDDSDRYIPSLLLGEESGIPSSNIYYEPRGKTLWDACSGVLKPAQLFMRLRPALPYLYFEVWQGKDRSINQTDNPYAIFSDDYDNADASTYTRSVRDYRNYAFVAGEGEGDARVIVPVDLTGGQEIHRELWVDARDLQRKGLSDKEYKELLVQRGLEKLAEYRESEVAETTTRDNDSLRYKVDYDLGDLCTYIDKRAGIAINQRISEISIVYEGGKRTITPVFGESEKTVMQKIRRNAI